MAEATIQFSWQRDMHQSDLVPRASYIVFAGLQKAAGLWSEQETNRFNAEDFREI
jgi:hypothetical protein